jgi:hypothetical protein
MGSASWRVVGDLGSIVPNKWSQALTSFKEPDFVLFLSVSSTVSVFVSVLAVSTPSLLTPSVSFGCFSPLLMGDVGGVYSLLEREYRVGLELNTSMTLWVLFGDSSNTFVGG